MTSGLLKFDRSDMTIEVVNRWQSFSPRCWTMLTRPRSVLALSVTSAVYIAALLLSTQRHFRSSDFAIYYVWALGMRKGLDVYTTDLSSLAAGVGLDMGHWTKANYPPTFILCFEPLSLLSPREAWWTWATLNIALLSVGLSLLLSDGFDFASGLVLGTLAILYAPLLDHFHYGQAQILILMLLILALHSIRRGREVVAGVSLALAGLLKVYPLLLVGYLLVRRKWGVLLYMGVTFGIGLGLTCAFVGLSRTVEFLREIGPLTQQIGPPANVSVVGMISNVFWRFFSRSDPLADLARRAVVIASSLGVVILTIWATSNYHGEDGETDPAYALWVVAMVLLTPTAFIHYMVLLLLPFGLLAEAANRGRASLRAIWFGLASYALAETLRVDNILGLWQRPRSFAACIWVLASLSVILVYLSSYFLLSDEGIRLHKAIRRPGKEVRSDDHAITVGILQ